jgi:hypothetical protein
MPENREWRPFPNLRAENSHDIIEIIIQDKKTEALAIIGPGGMGNWHRE